MGAIRMVTPLPGPRSSTILERKSKVVSDSLDIHTPAVIDHGRGAVVTDVDGNQLLDFSGGLGCQLVGYSHPKVVDARAAGEIRSDLDLSVIRMLILGALNWTAEWYRPGPQSAAEIAREATTMICEGIGLRPTAAP